MSKPQASVMATTPSMMAVPPTISDQTMSNPMSRKTRKIEKDPEDESPARDQILNSVHRTKEEEEAEGAQKNSSETSSILIVVFALIAVALIALIVWLVLKQSSDRKDDAETRNLVKPTRLMPQGRGHAMPPPRQPEETAAARQMNADAAAIKADMDQIAQPKPPVLQSQVESGKESNKKKSSVFIPPKGSFADTIRKIDGKPFEPLPGLHDSSDESSDEEAPRYTKDNPDPSISRPGQTKPPVGDLSDEAMQTRKLIDERRKRMAQKNRADASDADSKNSNNAVAQNNAQSQKQASRAPKATAAPTAKALAQKSTKKVSFTDLTDDAQWENVPSSNDDALVSSEDLENAIAQDLADLGYPSDDESSMSDDADDAADVSKAF